jgi:2-oxo-3-hexenedioate decarboxylase
MSAVVDELFAAEAERREIEGFSFRGQGFSIEEAYAYQNELIARKVSMGDSIVGAKLGLTSKAKQAQMNVDEPGYGQLLASGWLAPEEPVTLDQLIHPRIEPEIVFHLAEDVSGPGVTGHDILDACKGISCGIEIIDSRYSAFKFSLSDVLADNTSAARYVFGADLVHPSDIPSLPLLGMMLEVNGDLHATACGAAILGSPADAVAGFANWLGERGGKLEGGWVIMSGGLTEAVPLNPGTVITASFAHLGSITLRAV